MKSYKPWPWNLKVQHGHIKSNPFGGYTVHFTEKNRSQKNWWDADFTTLLEARAFLHGLPKPSGYELIQARMKENEKWVLGVVRKANKLGGGWRTDYCGHQTYNAVARLVAKGKIKYNRRGGYTRRGYWVVKGAKS